MSAQKIVIGRIGDAYGLDGWCHIFSFTKPSENIFTYPNWQICPYQKKHAQWQPITIELHKPHGNAFVAKLQGCDNRDQALLFKNHTIAVDRIELPALKTNEYYWSDLIGLQVVNTKGESFGINDHLFEAGPCDIIAVQNKTTHYIPYRDDIVKSVDLEKKIMVVDWVGIA